MDNQQESFLEQWKIIKEFPKYEISNLGRIRNVITKVLKYTLKTHKSGYEYVQFKKDAKTYTKKVHRLVAIHFLQEPSKELVDRCASKGSGIVSVNHKDGNKLNNSAENLEWCDDQYNAKHASLNGLNPAPKGVLNGRAILAEDTVHRLCKEFEQGMTPKEACSIFNVSVQQASKIRAGIAWKHISENYDIKPLRKKKSSTTRVLNS